MQILLKTIYYVNSKQQQAKLQFKLQKLQMRPTFTSQQISTGIGSCLLHIVAGITTIWGSTNIYYLSYYHNNNYAVNQNTNSIILISIIIPLSIALILSTKICDKIGYIQTIKVCSQIFFVSQIILYVKFTLVLFTIFTLIIPVSCITVSLIPALNILWSHFMKQKSICTAVTLVFLGLGTIVWNIAFVQMVNPNNEEAEIDQENNAYFSNEVTSKLERATKIIMFLCSVLYLIGAFLMKDPNTQQVKVQVQKEKIVQIVLSDKKQIIAQQIDENNNNKENYKAKSQRYGLMKGSQEIIQVQTSPNLEQPKQQQIITEGPTEKQQFCIALKDSKCLLIFALLIVIDIYPIYLFSNFKVIFMPIFNDDHFLAFCIIVNTVSNIFGTFLWGFIAHKLGNIMTVAIVGSFALLGGILGFFSYNKIVILLFMFVFGIGDRGMQTIAGPVLVQIYGLRIATLLLPYKGLSLIVGFLLAPLFQIITSHYLTPYEVLRFLFVFCVLSFGIGMYYSRKYRGFDLSYAKQKRPTQEIVEINRQEQLEGYQNFQGQGPLESKITQN